MAQVLDRQADLEQDRGRPARVRLNGPRPNPPAEAALTPIVAPHRAASEIALSMLPTSEER